VLPQLYEGYRTGTFVLEHDRSATLDSLSHTLHAPRKAPIRLKVSAVVMRELRCDMDQLCMVVDRCPNLASLYLERWAPYCGMHSPAVCMQGREQRHVPGTSQGHHVHSNCFVAAKNYSAL